MVELVIFISISGLDRVFIIVLSLLFLFEVFSNLLFEIVISMLYSSYQPQLDSAIPQAQALIFWGSNLL